MRKKTKTLFLNDSPENLAKLWTPKALALAASYGVEIAFPGPRGSHAPWEEMIQDAEAVITTWGSPRLEGELLKKAARLKFVGHAAGSAANVASEEVYAAGIAVSSANPVMAEAVAEWSLMATLLVTRRLDLYAGIFGSGQMKWEARGEAKDLRGSVIGVWGYGDVASRFLKALAPLKPGGILVCSKRAPDEELEALGAERASFEELFAKADVIHLLAGLTKENLGKVGARELSSIKDGAALVNGGRAALVDEAALLAELSKKRFLAALDVFHQEPLQEDSPLRGLPNVLLTPHNAGGPGKELFVPFILGEIKRFFSGEPLLAEVSRERLGSMTVEALGFRK